MTQLLGRRVVAGALSGASNMNAAMKQAMVEVKTTAGGDLCPSSPSLSKADGNVTEIFVWRLDAMT